MDWKIAEAKQQFSELVKAAEDEPQCIYDRDTLVAAMVSAETLKEFLSWRHKKEERTLAEAFEELRRIAEEENYTLEIPPRQERFETRSTNREESVVLNGPHVDGQAKPA